MKLNKLSYRIVKPDDRSIKEKYFVDYEDCPTISFEFLIDGKTIGSLLETNNKAIPYYYFEGDLPSYFHRHRNKKVHIIGVCSCGVDGCGSATCVLEKGEDFVIFREIFKDGFEFPKDFQFKFSKQNYESIIEEIVKEAEMFETNNELQEVKEEKL